MERLTLAGRTIAIAESREVDLLARMLEQRGAVTWRCPLLAIHDAPDAEPVIRWLDQLIAGDFDDVVFLTGEGVTRLHGFAERSGRADAFIEALGRTRKITRGPKPGRALRELGLRPDIVAQMPTTAGVIATLAELGVVGHSVGVQLYGEDPNLPLVDFLQAAGARACTVAPYVYASKAHDQQVLELIGAMAAGRVDAIVFTSAAQVRRLVDLAQEQQVAALLLESWRRVRVAAIGPVAAEELRSHGIRVDLLPEAAFFMKPLITALEQALGAATITEPGQI